MGIHPIDLQTMYSNMSNVSMNHAAHEISGQATKQAADAASIQNNIEKSKQVNKAAENEMSSMSVNEDGRGGEENPNSNNRKKANEEKPEVPEKKIVHIRESYLGNHIDIEG